MTNRTLFDKFCRAAPLAVMTRCLAQHFISHELDHVFEQHRSRQYQKQAKFSAVALAVADVTLGFCENFNQAYHAHKQNLQIAITSFYDKLKATELSVSAAITSFSFEKAKALQQALKFQPRELLRGYNVLAFDGNHLAKTDKRLQVLHEVSGAPLPGTVIARFDLQRQLFEQAYLLEDAHAQESSTCPQIVADLKPNDVVVCDRHFCIVAFLEQIAARQACFVIRQHGRLAGVLQGKRRKIGKIRGGTVYEQTLSLSAAPEALRVRRITIVLDEPTRDGATEIHILSNLPDTISGTKIAELYRFRWDEERAFHQLQMTLTCELATVSHPRAALFLFCLAMFAYNLRQGLLAALTAAQGAERVAQVSDFRISVEVARATDGMLIALDQRAWKKLIPLTTRGLASLLKRIASTVDLSQYQKNVRGPKLKKPKRKYNVRSKHVSTARLLKIAQQNHP